MLKMVKKGVAAMYIMLFKPEFKERIWGGQKIKEIFNKKIPYAHTGESWEIACHNNGHSIIKNGKLKGLRLIDAIGAYPNEIIGHTLEENEKFPLLLKIIDAKEQLSVQVHPEDAYALKNENGELGKNEAWVILDAKEDATLILGLKEGVDKEAFVKAFREDKVTTVLNKVKVKKGDVMNIPAGFIHAIGAGVLLYEIQQNSDTTYRVYDWERAGLNGEKRELHIEKSLDVIDFKQKHKAEIITGTKTQEEGYYRVQYIQNEYFVLEKISIKTNYKAHKNTNNFELFMCINGEANVSCMSNKVHVEMGDSFMVPACIEEYTITGTGEFLKTYLPN